jgi:hypothetical protein
VHGETSPK